jgi:hypothetical protein
MAKGHGRYCGLVRGNARGKITINKWRTWQCKLLCNFNSTYIVYKRGRGPIIQPSGPRVRDPWFRRKFQRLSPCQGSAFVKDVAMAEAVHNFRNLPSKMWDAPSLSYWLLSITILIKRWVAVDGYLTCSHDVILSTRSANCNVTACSYGIQTSSST